MIYVNVQTDSSFVNKKIKEKKSVTTNNTSKEQKFLVGKGLINPNVFAGIQTDDCVRWKKTNFGFQHFSLCSHNCTIEFKGKPTGGNYICDSSFAFAKGVTKNFASADEIINWSKVIAGAHKLSQDMFFQNGHFDRYCEQFKIPPSWANAIKTELTDGEKKVECNRFGGSPEMLPDCARVISECKKAGMVVNLTSPGRRFMTDKNFIEDIAKDPPNILAFSFDDMDPEELGRISAMELEEIKSEWRNISSLHGQRQKAFEGLYAAKLIQKLGLPIKILFNVVIHPGNIKKLGEILSAISEAVPESLANPYPAQSFGCSPPCWTEESLPALFNHISNFTAETIAEKPGITKRLHYYILLEAAFQKWWSGNPKRLCEFISGINAWDMTLRPGAYRYAQIGKNSRIQNCNPDSLPAPGGHLGCFWNPVLGLDQKVSDCSVEENAELLLTGMVKKGKQVGKVQKTNIMPRLMFDMVSTELGIPEELVSTYLLLRESYTGF